MQDDFPGSVENFTDWTIRTEKINCCFQKLIGFFPFIHMTQFCFNPWKALPIVYLNTWTPQSCNALNYMPNICLLFVLLSSPKGKTAYVIDCFCI